MDLTRFLCIFLFGGSRLSSLDDVEDYGIILFGCCRFTGLDDATKQVWIMDSHALMVGFIMGLSCLAVVDLQVWMMWQHRFG